MNIGWLVLSTSRTAVRRLCGQLSGRPSGVDDQSRARINAPISPPPTRKSTVFAMGTLTFNIRNDRRPIPPPAKSVLTVLPCSALTGGSHHRPEIIRLPRPVKRAVRDLVQIYFPESGTK